MPQPIEVLKEARLKKLEEIKALGINPYPSRARKEHSVSQALKMIGQKVVVAGRIMAMRGMGGISFFDLVDETGKIQLVFKKGDLSKIQVKLLDLFDIGDFLSAQGEIFKTKSGEISVQVQDFQILSKSLRPLPSQWHGLSDMEERYRRRYLDLILNPEVRQRFNLRSKIVRAVQEYLDDQGYIEVETPVLQVLYGGTNAKPFKTHLNALDQDMYLRVADELYLKRLVVGGYEKVYEICKDFRNEGMDLSHNPEFTMIEFYESYADYQRIMDVTEGLFKFIAKKLFGEETMSVQGEKINLAGAWPRITMTDILKQELKLDVEKSTVDDLRDFARRNKIETKGGESKGELIYLIFDHLIPRKLIEPTWIVDYPAEVSPLAKRHSEKPGWVERFEGYIGGIEICDGWSEINDPQDQRSRFENEQKALKEGRNADAHPVDEDFLQALEYGLPTLGGIGFGIDRLTMFFTDTWSIKEVILFPLMRPSALEIKTADSISVPDEVKNIKKDKKTK
jgi:lysyl-tRNA synthetase, class II